MRLVVGTRGSALAIAQARSIGDKLKTIDPALEIDFEIIKTTGDRILNTPIFAIGEKSLFVKELESALQRNQIDLAVHSAKDLPAVLPSDLEIAAFPARENPSDVLITQGNLRWEDLPRQSIIGTGSLRRQAQLLFNRPDLQIKSLRGNVDTRLKKLDAGEYFGIVVAKAGLNRLGIHRGVALSFEVMLPAPGQGALAIEIRKSDQKTGSLVRRLNDEHTEICLKAERSFLKAMEGGCSIPLGALALMQGRRLALDGMLAKPDGRSLIREKLEGKPDKAEKIGINLAHLIIEKSNHGSI